MPTITCPQCTGLGSFEGGTCDLCAGDGKVTIQIHPASVPRIRPITQAQDAIRLILSEIVESGVKGGAS